MVITKLFIFFIIIASRFSSNSKTPEYQTAIQALANGIIQGGRRNSTIIGRREEIRNGGTW